MKIGIALLLAGSAWGQGQAVSQVSDPPPTAVLNLFYYDGSSNLQYVCSARQNQMRDTTQKRSDSTLTNIVDAANTSTVTTATAHGLYIGARVTITGATVDTDLNGTYTVATVPSSTTYTITTASVSDATYTESTLVITTYYPLTTLPVWAIKVLTYATTTLTATYWARASVGYGLACTDRTTY